jgi:hypothetical protein
MNPKHFLTLFFVVIALLVAPKTADQLSASNRGSTETEFQVLSDQDLPERDEIRRSYALLPGARIEVAMIYGPVDIENIDANVAEVYIIRSARRREDLVSRTIDIDHTSNKLVIQGERDRSQDPAKVRHRVLLKIPRQVELSVHHINARVNIGEINGTVQVHRINGALKVSGAMTQVEVSHINGSLNMRITGLSKDGISVGNVNGAIELRFVDELNADLVITEANVNINPDVPNVSILEKTPRGMFRARLGVGGVPISISDVNGSVRIGRSD